MSNMWFSGNQEMKYTELGRLPFFPEANFQATTVNINKTKIERGKKDTNAKFHFYSGQRVWPKQRVICYLGYFSTTTYCWDRIHQKKRPFSNEDNYLLKYAYGRKTTGTNPICMKRVHPPPSSAPPRKKCVVDGQMRKTTSERVPPHPPPSHAPSNRRVLR